VVWGLDTGVQDDQQTAVAIVAWRAYEAWTRAMGIGRATEITHGDLLGSLRVVDPQRRGSTETAS
jgi:hypothetical protein